MKRQNRIDTLQRQGFEINSEIVFSTAHLSEATIESNGFYSIAMGRSTNSSRPSIGSNPGIF